METLDPPDEVVVPPNPEVIGPVATIDELISLQQAILTKEAEDVSRLNRVFRLTDIQLRQLLIDWATIGFPSGHVLASTQLVPPPKCSDGVYRHIYNYAMYLLQVDTMQTVLDALDNRVTGMTFYVSTSEVNMIHLLVSKS